jgi:predicted naringenin-chalcone synthase
VAAAYNEQMMAGPQAVPPRLPSVSIVAIGTALPPRRLSQAEVLAWGLAHVPMTPEARELYRRVLGDDGILTRHFALDDLAEILETDHDRVLARFERWAADLSARSLARALEAARVDAGAVDFLAATTCTGYLCPGLTSYVMERARLRPDVHRVDLVGMGCGAALPALEQACHFLAAHPEGTAAVVSTEICSAAVLLGGAPDLVVSNAIFGDGSAAAILRRADRAASEEGVPPRARFLGFRSLTLPEWREALRFRTEGGHLRNVLSRDVPVRAGEACRRLVLDLLAEHGLRAEAVAHWVVHAGGRLVLDAIERAMDLPASALDAARAVLHEIGNVSSPTVLFVLDEQQRRRPPRAGDLGIVSAFGAGFSAHAALVEFSRGVPRGFPVRLDDAPGVLIDAATGGTSADGT